MHSRSVKTIVNMTATKRWWILSVVSLDCEDRFGKHDSEVLLVCRACKGRRVAHPFEIKRHPAQPPALLRCCRAPSLSACVNVRAQPKALMYIPPVLVAIFS